MSVSLNMFKSAHFIRFESPPIKSDAASFDEWIDRIELIETDLKWLLGLPHSNFWNQVVSDKSIHECLDSFLKFAPRPHDNIFTIPRENEKLYTNIYRYYFLVFLRLSTYKEPKSCMTSETFSDIIYTNFIFDIPKLMDLCVLFSASNSSLMERMVKNIFESQPKYFDDLTCVINTIDGIFYGIKERCHLNDSSNDPVKLSEYNSEQHLYAMSDSEFGDIVFYYMDIGSTLYHFLNTYPPVATYFSHNSFHVKLAQTYECVVRVLNDALKVKVFEVEETKLGLTKYLRSAQFYMLHSFKLIIQETYIKPILENISNGVDGIIEEYLNVMIELLNEKQFLGHMNFVFSIIDDLAILSQMSHTVDETRLQFVINGIQDSSKKHCKSKKNSKNHKSTDNHHETTDALDDEKLNNDYAEYSHVSKEENNDIDSVNKLQLASLISSVKDILPDIGEGFIEQCLKEMNHNSENVINALLENNLPPNLSSLDRKMPALFTGINPSMFMKRANVFDNDEIEVFSQNHADTFVKYKGKHDKYGETLLDDKEFLKKNRSRYDPYGTVTCEIEVSKDYDDEYDDTCELLQVNARDDDSADDLLHSRPFTQPRIFDVKRSKDVKYFSSDESEDEASSKDKLKDEFVLNPELVREAQQRRYQSRVNNRPIANKKHDVKGAAKGQGQTTTVVKNRKYKDANKSQMANHSRKYFADKKRKV